MLRHLLKYLFVLPGLAFFFAACDKTPDTPAGGVKGKIVLTATVQHHHWAVPSLSVYLKYNATDFPGTNSALYNVSATTDQGGAVQFKELTFGNYYLYAHGWDPVFGDTVYGHMPVLIDASTAGGNLVDVTMYVTE